MKPVLCKTKTKYQNKPDRTTVDAEQEEMRNFPAKVLPPVLHSSVYSRLSLYNRLDHYLKQQIVWIAGPPGSGKTTVTSDFAASRSLRTIWYQIDSVDTDPVTFFHYMQLALSAFLSGKTVDLPRYQPEDAMALPLFSRRFFRSFYEQCSAHFLLVFDNYQDLPGNSVIHDSILIALEELPGNGNAILLSRKQPSPLFSRMQLNGMLQLVDWRDLALSVQEIKKFLRMRGNTNFKEHDVALLHKKTDGWIAGITLLLEDMNPGRMQSMCLVKEHYQAVFNYFAGEILQRENHEKREILFHAALLKDINPDIVEELSGKEGVEQYLTELSGKHYFTYTLKGNIRPHFQFHPLFREFLLAEGQRTCDPVALQLLRRNAATILCENDNRSEGIDLLSSIADWDAVMEMLKKYGPHLLLTGRFQSILHWLEQLPSEYGDDPWHLYLQGMATLIFNPEQAVQLLNKAYVRFSLEHEEENMLKACSGIIDALLLNLSDLRQVDHWLAILSEKLTPEELQGAENGTDTAALIASVYHGLVLRQPDHPDIDTWNELYETHVTSGSSAVLHYLWTGRFTRTRVSLDKQLSSERAGKSALFRSTLYSLQAFYFLFKGDCSNGLKAVTRGLETIEQSGVTVWEFHLLAHAAGCCLVEGEVRKAESYFKRALQVKDQARTLDFSYYHLLRAWQALLQEEKLQAQYHQKVAMTMAEDIGIPFLEGICCYAGGMVALALQRYEEAEEQLQRSLAISCRINNAWTESQNRLGLAYLYMATGNEQQSCRELRAGLSLAAQYDYTAYFFCLPRMMADLCIQAFEADIETEFVKVLIRSRNLLPNVPPLHLPQWPWPIQIHTLGRFSVRINGEGFKLSSVTRSKPLKLLQVLIALGGRQVSETRLADQLWYDQDGDNQLHSLKTTLHRLRKFLGVKNAIVHKNKNLTLNPQQCWVDTWAFTGLAEQCDNGLDTSIDQSVMEQQAEEAILLYRGIFLPERLDDPWTFVLRDQLKRRYRHAVICAGQAMEDNSLWEKAIGLYHRALECDVTCESFYCSLMRCYHSLGFSSEAIAIYRQCERALQVTAANPLSPPTVMLFQKIVSA